MAIVLPILRQVAPIRSVLDAGQLAELARQALVAEVELTPKPGLVDRRGAGAHSDLSLDLMRQSAAAIAPYFEAMGDSAQSMPFDRGLRTEVAAIGRAAESAMLQATNGSNAHKGAIWILGLLVTAASRGIDLNPAAIAQDAAFLARLPDRAQPQLLSHGEMVRARYGATGARGEAFAGFPHVLHVGLPTLRAERNRARTETNSRLWALLNIMARLEDTCVLYRGGAEGLAIVQKGASDALLAGGPGSVAGELAMLRLDQELLIRNISPGGAADLLAATLFLDALEQGQNAIEDNSLSEEVSYGTD
ncbi:MAG TPA: triphosphoribosyl-dephospho-CoA synthase [Candidatus Acidoferrum sp.]|jgi:triphosphoribosyl-dephospho-CoA synthase|nr:triphosphoribosyl-dephospho-CoA synthase [Candidatus Acidoferrum sp.]HWO32039.1 triphosphoribosyl-dephospho-CoA synthase [Candidatus Acidoferrum sp.]HXC95018.1 triphosphoribosyl-dephospho-CoA synthase [Edaphobacter sp.]